jgi:hypothetical protein
VGRIVTAPQGDGGQCVDLAVLWAQANKLPRVWGDAAQWVKMYDPHLWQRVWNTPHNSPPAGALIVWHKEPAVAVGDAGHIAVCVAATAYTILSVDQNWPEGSGVHYQNHGYHGVVGWLIPLAHATTTR